VVTEVIFEFYWEKFLCKGHILQARVGPGGPEEKLGHFGPGRAAKKWPASSPVMYDSAVRGAAPLFSARLCNVAQKSTERVLSHRMVRGVLEEPGRNQASKRATRPELYPFFVKKNFLRIENKRKNLILIC
jgi:hypothetical protein